MARKTPYDRTGKRYQVWLYEPSMIPLRQLSGLLQAHATDRKLTDGEVVHLAVDTLLRKLKAREIAPDEVL